MERIVLKEYSELISGLYDVVTDSNKWNRFLEKLCRVLESDGCHIAASDFDKAEITFSVQFGGTDQWLEEYAEYAFDVEDDARAKFALEYPFRPFHCGMLPSLTDFRESKIFREFFEPRDIYYHLGVSMSGERSSMLAVVLWRGKEKQPYSDAECDLLGEVSLHLNRVIQLQRLFHEAQFTSNPAIEVLEMLPIGIILCDRDAHSYFMNEMAQTVTKQNNGLIYRHGELWGESPAITHDLRHHIRQAVDAYGADETLPVATMNIDRRQGKSPLHLMVSAVSASTPAVNVDMFRQAVAVIYLSDPDIRQETSTALLQRLFALTLAEARLLQALIDRASLKDAAEANGITEGTARGYLKQIFSKTHTNSQIELIRLVSNSPAWLRHQAAEPFAPLNSD